jgi:carbon starvation protein
MKLGTIFLLALGIFLVLPTLKMPALTQFTDGSGLVVAGKVFPFCFITIACGAISGFHTLIASGTTPKLITRESYARPIGYGAMCLESLVAIMAIIAACTMEPGVYLAMNVKGEAAATAGKVTALGFPVTVEHMEVLAKEVGEHTLFGRTGGAATLAVGMAQIFHEAVGQRALDLWYHFAIMFEALFILTTLDAGTRVGRYILQDFLGNLWKPLGNTKAIGPNLLASGMMVCGWGYFLIQGVRDPLGGINSLWPLFGIANQMLAAIALCLATTIILKMQISPKFEVRSPKSEFGKPALALTTLIPLVWLLAVTFTAGVQKIGHADPRIGFLAQAAVLQDKLPALDEGLRAARAAGDVEAIEIAEKALKANQTLRFNNRLDAFVAGVFLLLVSAVVLISVREWILLLARKKIAEVRETPPVWLPDYAVAEGKPLKLLGLFALAFALAKELSGEAQLERAREQRAMSQTCGGHCSVSAPIELSLEGTAPSVPSNDSGKRRSASLQELYVETTEQRFNGVRRCC